MWILIHKHNTWLCHVVLSLHNQSIAENGKDGSHPRQAWCQHPASGIGHRQGHYLQVWSLHHASLWTTGNRRQRNLLGWTRCRTRVAMSPQLELQLPADWQEIKSLISSENHDDNLYAVGSKIPTSNKQNTRHCWNGLFAIKRPGLFAQNMRRNQASRQATSSNQATNLPTFQAALTNARTKWSSSEDPSWKLPRSAFWRLWTALVTWIALVMRPAMANDSWW